MASELPKPTRRTTLTQLCQELVPAWTAALADPAHSTDTPAVCVQVTVDDDTQHVILHVQGPKHTVGPAVAPHLCITCDKDAWRTAMESLLPLAITNLETRLDKARGALTVLQPHAEAALQTFLANPGNIVFTFTDDAGDNASFTFRLGSGSGPTTRIGIDDKRLHALISGHARMPQVLGAVDIQGDAAYLTRLVQVLMT